jgi:hypothetical protein
VIAMPTTAGFTGLGAPGGSLVLNLLKPGGA